MDLSGVGTHATTYTGSATFSSNDAIVFDGNDSLEVPANALTQSSYTIAVVEKRSSASNNNYFMGQIGSSSANNKLHFGYRYDSQFTIAHYSNDSEHAVPTKSNEYNIVIGRFENGTLNRSLFFNGNETQKLTGTESTSPLSNSGNLLIGQANNAHYSGDIQEVLVFNSALSDADITGVEAYLAKKWNLTTTVDSDNDGFTDAVEIAFGSTTTDASSVPQFIGDTASNPGSSCKMIADAAGAPLSDGVYWIQLSNGPANAFEVYCHNMTSDFPTEYLELKKVSQGLDTEGFNWGSAGIDDINAAITNGEKFNYAYNYFSTSQYAFQEYAKLRLYLGPLSVDITDRTFSTHYSVGTSGHVTRGYIDLGVAAACQGGGQDKGKGNVDLRDTPFKAPSSLNVFTKHGWPGGSGSSTWSSNEQVINITGGDHCGHVQLSAENNNRLMLEFLNPEVAVPDAGTSPTDASSNLILDLSETVDAEIGSTSGLDAVESKLALWLDASSESHFILDSNNNISTWLDMSGNGANFNEVSGRSKPIYLPISQHVDLNRGNMLANLPSHDSTELTLFVVYNKNSNASPSNKYDTILYSDKSNGTSSIWFADHKASSSTFSAFLTSSGSWEHFNSGETNPGMQIAVVKTNDAGGVIYQNGPQIYPSSGLQSDMKPNVLNGVTFEQDQPMYLGSTFNGSHPSDAHVAEILMFYDDLTDEQINAIEYYLSSKWNLTGLVDSDADGFADNLDAAPMDPAIKIDMTGKPAILADAKLWLDASNVDGYNNISLSDGDTVSTWTDLSGNGNDLSGGVAPNYDSESNMVNFDSGDYLTVFDRDSLRISGNDHSIIIVLHPDATDHNDFISTWESAVDMY